VDEETRGRIRKVMGGFECPHDFRCVEDRDFCQTSQLEMTDQLQCCSPKNEDCSFAVSFTGGKLCTCPLQRFYKEHNIRKTSRPKAVSENKPNDDPQNELPPEPSDPPQPEEKAEGINKLFAEKSQPAASGENAEPAGEEPPPGQKDPTAYRCYRCNTTFSSIEEMKFCNKCGAPVNPVRTGASKRVLVVDDSHLARKKITAILKKLSCQVIEAEDGRKGVAAALKENPDLIVLDVQMPIVNGLQALQALRKNPLFDSMPILMMTVESDAQVVSQSLAAGANDYIRKDSPIAELLSRLSKHVSQLG
jgi:CheY-like chemotaxis protein